MLLSTLPPWLSMNFADCTNIPPEPAARVVNAAVIRLQYLDKRADDAGGRVKFSGKIALLFRKFRETILIGAPENIFAVAVLHHLNISKEIDNLAKPPFVQFHAGKVFEQDILEPFIFFSILRMASSMIMPISGVCAAAEITLHLAFSGTKKIFSAVYSSLSSSKPSPSATRS